MDASTPKRKDSASARPENPDEISAKKPSAPLWSDESDSRRVRVAIWSHDQKGGKVRYTISICRSYFDEDDRRWVNTHYFDRRDLEDVIAFAQAARKKLDRISGESEPD